MSAVHTTCPMDCPDTCTLDVEVDAGRIISISGSHDHPTTAGFICSKVAHFAKRYHESRLLYPMRRTGPKGSGEFERISWDEAIATVATRFRAIADESGAEAILPYRYGGSNGFISDGLVDELFFTRFGASQLARTLCAAPTGTVATAMYGKMPGTSPEDFAHAKFILLWGANPRASQIHLVPFLQQAKRNGAFVVTIDPRNELARATDLYLPIYPGTDLPLALAMINLVRESGAIDESFLIRHADGWDTVLEKAAEWPVERAAAEARIDPDSIRRLTSRYIEASPALIRCGWGLERNVNGSQAVAAILALPALAGKFGVCGGGYLLSNSGAAKLGTKGLMGDTTPNTRTINMVKLGEALTGDLDPPVRALFVYNCNPVATVPDQGAILRGLEREDLFTVVSEQVMTDTALYADILLPATTFLEHYEIKRGYGTLVVGGSRPVIEPAGESKPNEEVFAALGRAMGFEDEPFRWSTEDCMRYVAANLDMSGTTPDLDVLRDGGIVRYDFPGTSPVQFVSTFPPTGDARAHLSPSVLGSEPFSYTHVGSERFPLALITPASSKLISSTMGEFNVQELFVTISPQDAAARTIASGDVVRVFNDLGEVVCKAIVSSAIRDGVVSMPKGAWRKASRTGRTSTSLAPASIDPVAGGACFNDARVEITRFAE